MVTSVKLVEFPVQPMVGIGQAASVVMLRPHDRLVS